MKRETHVQERFDPGGVGTQVLLIDGQMLYHLSY